LITLCVRGLPRTTTEESITELFSEYGTIHSLKLIKDLFSGECKGIAIIDMEGHEARAAIAGLDGKSLKSGTLRVGPDWPGKKGRRGGRH
jgi:RNA recognition motif-containing protein